MVIVLSPIFLSVTMADLFLCFYTQIRILNKRTLHWYTSMDRSFTAKYILNYYFNWCMVCLYLGALGHRTSTILPKEVIYNGILTINRDRSRAALYYPPCNGRLN
jgi:hypothetical protein